MNDKRCPACDVLIDESTAQCSCQFVFWDDTPDHVITFGRLVFAVGLLVGALVVGVKLSHPTWAGQAKLTLAALGGVALTFNIMPNIRKHGGFALSIAMVVLSCTAFSIGKLWWEANPPVESELVVAKAYDGSELTMSGLRLGQKVPKNIPNGVQIESDDDGLIVALTGRSIQQGEARLVKSGDRHDLVRTIFRGRYFGNSIYHLEGDKSLVVRTGKDGKKVESISILEGIEDGGRGPYIDSIRIGMTESMARVITRELKGGPKIVYSEKKPRKVVGLLGEALGDNKNGIRKGQHIDTVSKLYVEHDSPLVAVFCDEKSVVKVIARGKIAGGLFGTPILPKQQAGELKARHLYQICTKTDKMNRPLNYAEEWMTPIGHIKVHGPLASTNNYVFNQREKGHREGLNGERESKFALGERSHWSGLRCEFLHRKEYFILRLYSQSRRLTDKEKAYFQEFGQAIIKSRSSQ